MSYSTTLQTLKKKIKESKALLGQTVDNDQDYSIFHNLPFYYWDKPKGEQQGTFVDLVGLPRKNNVEHGFCDYEKQIIDYLERDEPTDPTNKHLYILKSVGLGITTCLRRGWFRSRVFNMQIV